MFNCFQSKKASHYLLAFFIFYSGNSFSTSYLSIIIDDIGDQYQSGKQALMLPGKLTYALLPYSTHANELSKIGLKSNKEFILHSPMQSVDSRLKTNNTLHMHMTETQFVTQLQNQIAQFPFIKGINNHMGSLLTMHPGYMTLLMQQLKTNKSLYFIDSRTTVHSVALTIAKENNIPTLKRDVFIDTHQDTKSINSQLDRAIKLSKNNGYAVAIAHPYPVTLQVLKKRLPEIENSDIKLVTASSLINKLSELSHEKSTDTLSAGL